MRTYYRSRYIYNKETQAYPILELTTTENGVETVVQFSKLNFITSKYPYFEVMSLDNKTKLNIPLKAADSLRKTLVRRLNPHYKTLRQMFIQSFVLKMHSGRCLDVLDAATWTCRQLWVDYDTLIEILPADEIFVVAGNTHKYYRMADYGARYRQNVESMRNYRAYKFPKLILP